MTLRDNMTLAEAQAEAERRWPGASLRPTAQSAVTMTIGTITKSYTVCILFIPVGNPPEGAEAYFAYTPVGCLDQAIAAEARRLGPTPTHERCVACGTSVPISDWAAMSWHGLLVKGSRHG